MDPPVETGNTRSLSYWIDSVPPGAPRPTLTGDVKAEVAIIGGGMAGLTAAYLLAKAGKDVVLLEKGRLALAETGHTTAHLQTLDDSRVSDLVPRLGLDRAKLVWESHLEAVRAIEDVQRDERISCEFTHLDAYLYSPHANARGKMKEERRLARKLGWDCDWAETGAVPFPSEHVLRYADQAKFHPRKYLAGLADAAERLGARLHEGTEVSEVKGGRHVKLSTKEGATVKADWLLCCTNTPFVGSETIHTKLEPYRTYVVAAEVPRTIFQERLYWDTLDPYHYTRVERKGDRDLVIHGGEDHRVGEVEDTQKAWGLLWQHLQEATDEFTPVYQWSGQVMETIDELPYIGRVPGERENVLMVTGDSGTGMTFGTIGAMILAERVLGRGTPWDELYDPQRVLGETHSAKEWLKHNLQAGGILAKRMLQPGEIKDVAELRYGEGALMKIGGKPVAVARTDEGELCAVSGSCTHMGCPVKWNSGERSWDCGCHGSRFSVKGDVLHGPANAPLPEVDIEDVLEKRRERTT